MKLNHIRSSPGVKLACLRPFQTSAASKIINELAQHPACLLMAKTGIGKTFVVGDVIHTFINDILPERLKSCLTTDPMLTIRNQCALVKVLYVTRPKVISQTKWVLKAYFGLSYPQVDVVSYDSLRSKAGETFIDTTYDEAQYVSPKTGELTTKKINKQYSWHSLTAPLLIIYDECHALRYTETAQGSIGLASAELATNQTQAIFLSATPFVAPIDCAAYARWVDLNGWRTMNPKHTWERIAKQVCAPSSPCEHTQAGMDRMMKALPGIIRIPNIRTEYKSKVNVKLIQFDNEDQLQSYKKAFDDYIKERSQYKGNTVFGRKGELVAMLKFRQRAELIRAPYIARMLNRQAKEGFQPIAACNFQTTIAKVTSILVHQYNWKREDISLVWGGNDIFNPLAKTFEPQEIFDILARAFSMGQPGSTSNTSETPEELQAKVDLVLKQIKQTSQGLSEDLKDPSLHLGPQSQKECDEQINRFQSGKSIICLFTFKAGSVGLSLHHTQDYFVTRPDKYKRKRGEDGWRYLDDTPVAYSPRPRYVIISPTWSAIEFIQAQGRGHRLTSESDTQQEVIFYANTIEESVALGLGEKLNSIRASVQTTDSWMALLEKKEFVPNPSVNSVGDYEQVIASSEFDEVVDDESDDAEDTENTGGE